SAESTTSVIPNKSGFWTSQRCAYSSNLIASYPVYSVLYFLVCFRDSLRLILFVRTNHAVWLTSVHTSQ
ncbi:hypothetical protein N9Q76_03180, partial [Flavobacteriales bacterium]|nr:hypothetical protein [Flavobacteriales bacterium]